MAAKALETAEWSKVDDETKRKICELVGTDLERAERDAKTLLEWVNQQPHLPTLADTELPFVRAYLIGKKNSMEKAKQGLDLYYTSRTAQPKLFGNYDITVEEMRALSKYETLGSSLEHTPELYRVVYGRLMDPKSTFEDVSVISELKVTIMKADFNSRMDWFAGVEFVYDVGNFNYHYAKRMALDIGTYKAYVDLVMGTIPLRVKRIHLVNPPQIFSKTLPLIFSLFKEKMRKRILLHDNLESLHKCIPPKYLPSDLGGDLPSCQVTEEKRIPFYTSPATQEFCAYQRTLRTDESKRPGGPSDLFNETNFGCDGSFRKLTLD